MPIVSIVRLRGGLVQIVAGALALAASVFLIACGSEEGVGEDGLASLTPPDAPLYVETVIDPTDDQAAALDGLIDRFGGLDPRAQLVTGLDGILESNGIDATYAEDIEPWLGDRAGVFIRSFEPSGPGDQPDFGLMVEVEDAGAARDFIEEASDEDAAEEENRSYDGTDYVYQPSSDDAVGVVDDSALVLGSEAAFKVAVDAADGEALAGSEDYESHVEQLPDDALATAFFEPASVIEAAIRSEDIDSAEVQALQPLLGGPLSEPVAGAVTVNDDSVSADFAATLDSDSPESTQSSLLEALPADSWFAAGLPDLGPTLERNLDQITNTGLPGAGQIESQIERQTGLDLAEDVFSWLGDVGVFVEGTDSKSIALGLLAKTSDPEGPRKLLEAIQVAAELESGRTSNGPPKGSDYGFTYEIPGEAAGVEAGVIGDTLVGTFGVSIDDLLNPDTTLADDPSYADAVTALGEGMAPALFVDLPQIIQVAEIGAADDPPGDGFDYDQIRPYVGNLGSLIAGSRHTDGLVVTRVTVTLTPQ